MSLNHDPESWARVKPEAVMSGSHAQAVNVLQMALDDIQRQASEIRRLQGLLNQLQLNGRPTRAQRRAEIYK